jgi:hypothetical protein
MAAMHREDDKVHRENEATHRENQRRLDDRLEALRQTVELMAAMHRDNDKVHQENQKTHRENQELHRQNESRLAAVMDTMNRMGRILEAHDITIDLPEQRIENLEKPGQ